MTAPSPVITARRDRSNEGTAYLSGDGSEEQGRRDCSEGTSTRRAGRNVGTATIGPAFRPTADEDEARGRGGCDGRAGRAGDPRERRGGTGRAGTGDRGSPRGDGPPGSRGSDDRDRHACRGGARRDLPCERPADIHVGHGDTAQPGTGGDRGAATGRGAVAPADALHDDQDQLPSQRLKMIAPLWPPRPMLFDRA